MIGERQRLRLNKPTTPFVLSKPTNYWLPMPRVLQTLIDCDFPVAPLIVAPELNVACGRSMRLLETDSVESTVCNLISRWCNQLHCLIIFTIGDRASGLFGVVSRGRLIFAYLANLWDLRSFSFTV